MIEKREGLSRVIVCVFGKNHDKVGIHRRFLRAFFERFRIDYGL